VCTLAKQPEVKMQAAIDLISANDQNDNMKGEDVLLQSQKQGKFDYDHEDNLVRSELAANTASLLAC